MQNYSNLFSFREVIRAIRCYGLAHRLIRKQKLWKWIVLPGLLHAILFCFGVYFVWILSEYVTSALSAAFGIERWIQKLESGWVSFIFILMGLSVRLVFFSFSLSLLKYFFVIAGSPYFDRLAALTEQFVNPLEPSISSNGAAAHRTTNLAGRNFLLQTVSLFAFLIIAFIPVAGWVIPLLCYVVECYFFGFSMLDHACRLHRLSYGQSIRYISDHRGLAIGNGIVFYLLMFIPVLGWILGPGYAIIAATISLRQKS
jgi:CysZ protein